MIKRIFPLIVLVFFAFSSSASTTWHADWITMPGEDGHDYGVYYFRKTVELGSRPTAFPVYVSADNRYKLFINGTLVSLGPARNDIYHWNYETVDLAPWLVAGKNTVCAIVWNEADHRPEAQLSFHTAFILQGASPAEEILNTNKSWKCMRDSAYRPINDFFFAASSGELVNRNHSVNNWMAAAYDDVRWPFAAQLFGGQPKGNGDGFGWMLVPSKLPPREMRYQRIPVCRKADGITVPDGFPAQKARSPYPRIPR